MSAAPEGKVPRGIDCAIWTLDKKEQLIEGKVVSVPLLRATFGFDEQSKRKAHESGKPVYISPPLPVGENNSDKNSLRAFSFLRHLEVKGAYGVTRKVKGVVRFPKEPARTIVITGEEGIKVFADWLKAQNRYGKNDGILSVIPVALHGTYESPLPLARAVVASSEPVQLELVGDISPDATDKNPPIHPTFLARMKKRREQQREAQKQEIDRMQMKLGGTSWMSELNPPDKPDDKQHR